MRYVRGVFEPHGINGAKGVAIVVLNYFHDAGGAEAFGGLRIGWLIPALGVYHLFGKGEEVFLAGGNPDQRRY